MPTEAFAYGATITLNPIDADGADIEDLDDVTVYLAADGSEVQAAFGTDDVVHYILFGQADSGGVNGILVGVPGSGALPPIPDDSKDYALIHDHSQAAGARIKWVEIKTFVCP